jgi:hypothetical protein
MPKKSVSGLTQDEIVLLTVAARLFAALRERAACPPPPSVNAHWQAKARDELVINSTSRSCNESNVNEPGNCFADV